MVGNTLICRLKPLAIMTPFVFAFLSLALVGIVFSAAAQPPDLSRSPVLAASDRLQGLESLTGAAPPANVVGESGSLTLANSLDSGHLQTVTLATEYSDPIVVAFINSRNGNDSIDVRVSDVTSTTFRIFMQEPDNSPHPSPEHVSYIVMESGRHTLDGGLVVEAGSVETDLVHRDGQTVGGVPVPFILPFAQQPVVLYTLNSYNNRDFMSSLGRAVSRNGFTAQLEAAGSGSPVQIETIGWIAFSKGVGLTGGRAYEVGRAADGLPDGVDDGTPQAITFTTFATNPDVVVKPNNVNGTDGSWSRGAGVTTNMTQTVFAEEDQVGDPERNHLSTSFAWAAFAPNTIFRAACFIETDGDAALDFSSIDHQALQDAHDAAISGATLKVAGTCAGVGSRAGFSQTLYISRGLTIQGGYTFTNWLAMSDPETYSSVLDAKKGGYVVHITGTNAITLDGLTLQSGDAASGGDDESEGGGIYMDGMGLLTVANSILQYNKAEIGGAIYSGYGAGVIITASQLLSNTADNLGGGFYSREGWADIFNTLFKDNVAGKGGALYNTHGNVMTVISSTIDSNQALLAGAGGIYNGFAGSLVVSESVIKGNWSGTFGGGIINDAGFLSVLNSTLVNNHADLGGGALFNNAAFQANFTGVGMMGNTAAVNGGAILNQSGSPLLLNQSFIDANGTTASNNDAGGGAIFNSTGGVITIIESTVNGNATVGNGGALYNSAGSVVTIADSDIDNNMAQGDGGALYNDDSLLTISNSRLNGNTAEIGGAIYNRVQSLQVTSSAMSDNTATIGAGALYNGSEGQVTLEKSTLSGNMSVAGGGIVTLSGAVQLSASTMVSNTATENGGAVYVVESGAVFTASNSTLSENTAGGAGGAVHNAGGTAALINSTLSDNGAGGQGGGLFTDLPGGVTTMLNSIVANSPSGGDCVVVSPGVVLDDGHNLVEDGSCLTAGTSQSGDPALGPLSDNGGGTLTHALLLSSPARDAGRNGACASEPINNLDQRGQPRPADGDGDGLAICDLGAVEMADMLRVFLPVILK